MLALLRDRRRRGDRCRGCAALRVTPSARNRCSRTRCYPDERVAAHAGGNGVETQRIARLLLRNVVIHARRIATDAHGTSQLAFRVVQCQRRPPNTFTPPIRSPTRIVRATVVSQDFRRTATAVFTGLLFAGRDWHFHSASSSRLPNVAPDRGGGAVSADDGPLDCRGKTSVDPVSGQKQPRHRRLDGRAKRLAGRN